MTPDDSNSGFFLHGRQEIQILGDYKAGKADKTCNGSIYNFKAPTSSSPSPAANGRPPRPPLSATGSP